MLHASCGSWVVQSLVKLNYHRNSKDSARWAKCRFQRCPPDSHQQWRRLSTNNCSGRFGSEWMTLFSGKLTPFSQLRSFCFRVPTKCLLKWNPNSNVASEERMCGGACVWVSLCVCEGRSWSKKWFKARTRVCMQGIGDMYFLLALERLTHGLYLRGGLLQSGTW